MIIQKKSAKEIESYAQVNGLLLETLFQNGLRLITEGVTTVEEVLLKTKI
jgi:type II secretory ATPase GspE/PulE/Tfp pilus assembly ATPase PilB-like protein